MAGVSPTSSGNTVQYGTNVAPISFPGIASGIDYNSIISKLSAMQMVPANQDTAQITTLTQQNSELIKINGLFASVQNSLMALSQSSTFNSYDATSSDPTALSASGIPNVSATPGTYVIDSVQLATPTAVTSNPNAGVTVNPAVAMASSGSGLAITPTNGTGTSGGKLTINGVQISYNVATDSVNTIIADINTNASLQAMGVAASISPAGVFSITDSTGPLALGSAGDSGNLLQVLKLDAAQVQNGVSSGRATGAGPIGGINQATSFDDASNAGFATAVTAGTFTINGVAINILGTDNLASAMTKINDSAAGVVASYNGATGLITLTNKTGGAQSIVIGSGSDTSNFLSAAGLTSSSGATTAVGSQAVVTYQSSAGTLATVYGSGNTLTNVIPGISLTLTGSTATPFQVTVNQDTTALVSAINTFVSAYNAAIDEIDQATAPPVVSQTQSNSSQASLTSQTSSQVGGGILFNNADVLSIKDELVNLVTSLTGTPGDPYNSLASIGLSLDSSMTMLTSTQTGVGNTGSSSSSSSSTSSTSSTSGGITMQTLGGTSGQFAPLNVTTLAAAMVANPTAVQSIFNGTNGVVTQIGTYLTNVTGSPTIVDSGLLGTSPSVSLMQNFENANSSSISTLQNQVSQITSLVNMQADALRQEFTTSESQIATYQSLQSQLSGMLG